ncbi:Neprilysin-2 [Exaiptasia diaphana]|nr:Neprilysin-2 [Exaiptasia diaphana]
MTLCWTAGRSPAQVNGFYSPLENKITYLAGILQLPFYSSEYPSYMQYGGIGMVIGHELTHGFDSKGLLCTSMLSQQEAVMHEHARNRCVITTMGSRIRVE